MKQARVQLLLFISFLLFSALSYGQIYRCSVNGKVVFTDEPCDGDVVELGPLNVLPAVDGDLSSTDSTSSYSSTKWFKNYSGYQRALRVSKKYNAPILLYFQADWCRYCRQLEKNLLELNAVQPSLKRVVKVRISPEDGNKENQLFRELGGTGYPSIYTMKTADKQAKKRRLMRKNNGVWQTKSAEEFNRMLNALSLRK